MPRQCSRCETAELRDGLGAVCFVCKATKRHFVGWEMDIDGFFPVWETTDGQFYTVDDEPGTYCQCQFEGKWCSENFS